MTHHPGCLSLDNVLGKHACDCQPGGMHQLMRAQLTREFELAHTTQIQKLELRIALLRRTFEGLATNSTACKACALHNEIYLDALARDEKLR